MRLFGTNRVRAARWMVCVVIGASVAAQIGCGTAGTPPGSSQPPPPPVNISVTIAPTSASVAEGGAQEFTVTVSGNANESADVTWNVNGTPGGNATVGTIAATSATTALYTAPAMVPTPAAVTVTATSVADTTKSASATVTITCSTASSMSPASASVGLGQTQTFSASFCLAAGATVAWNVNGIAGGNSAVGTIAASGAATVTYTAPTDLPATDPVTIDATASAVTENASSVSATVTITSGVSVAIAPSTATLSRKQRQSFAATVTNSPEASVTWTVNGAPNGNAAVGQVCVSGTSPCVAPSGPSSGTVDYLAPATTPAMNPVTLTATSQADPSKSATASITISAPQGAVSVTISPAYAFVARSGATPSTLQFTATVANSTDTNVTWSVQSGVAGQGCAETACGSISTGGLYTAPTAAPSPNAIAVTATSAADPMKSGTAMIAIASGPAIESLLPSSVMAGAVESFPLEVKGVNFVAGSGMGASAIVLNGTARATTCATTTT